MDENVGYDFFIVSLKDLPIPENYPFMQPQPLDNATNLKIYFHFKNDHPFAPHRYPPWLTENCNVLMEPWKINEHFLTVVTGLSAYHFWTLCDDLEDTGLRKKITGYTIPTLSILFRARFRQNASNYLLAALTHTNVADMSKNIWMVIFFLFSRLKQRVRLWCNPNIKKEEKNVQFAAMIANYDDLMAPLARLF